MSLRKFLVASALVATALMPLAAAVAQTVPRVGATITDRHGGEVGTVAAVEGDMVIVRTDRHEAALPAANFEVTDEVVLSAITRDELNARIDQALAEAEQAFRVGVNVHDRDGVLVGPVEAVDGESLTVRLGQRLIRLPRSAATPGQNGLVIGATLAELRAQIGG